MSSLWDAIVRRFRSAFIFICPFCANDYQYARPAEEPAQDQPAKDVYEPRKARDKKYVRKGADERDDAVVVVMDEEAGFSSRSGDSNSQCPDVEVENSEELNMMMIRKSQFLPPEPTVQGSAEQHYVSPGYVTGAEQRDNTFGRTLQRVTLERPVSPVASNYPKPHSPVHEYPITPTLPSPSPDDFADSVSQISKKSKRSVFGFGKKKVKKPKKDGDTQSVFSFASFKSGKSVSEKSEALERKEEKKRRKEEKKDKKQVERQTLKLSQGLNQQKFQNIYPWMNEVEPFDDDDEIPDLKKVMLDIKIAEAQERNKLIELDMQAQRTGSPTLPSMIAFDEDRSYAAESFLDLGTQMMPISQLDEPKPASPMNQFGKGETLQAVSFSPTPVQKEIPVTRLRQMSSDPETDGIVRKARKSLAALDGSISIESPDEPAPPGRRQSLPVSGFQKKDIFANVLPPSSPSPPPDPPMRPLTPEQAPFVLGTLSRSPEPVITPKEPPRPIRPTGTFKQNQLNYRKSSVSPITNLNTKSESSEDRDLKREIEEVTQREDFLETISMDVSEKKRPKRRKNKERSSSKRKTRGPPSIQSNPIEDRSIDDIPIQKDDADFTNPILFPEPNVGKKPKEIPMVNYTKTLERTIRKKKDDDKSESIKEIQDTLDKRKREASANIPPEATGKVTNSEPANQDVRVVVNQELAENRLGYFHLDDHDAAVDQLVFKKLKDERDLLLKHGAQSGSRIPGQKHDSEKSDVKRERRTKRDSSERSNRRKRRSETEEERSERKSRRRKESDTDRSERRSRRRDETEEERLERKARHRSLSEAERSERKQARRERRKSGGERRKSRAESDNEIGYRSKRRASVSSPDPIADIAAQPGRRRSRTHRARSDSDQVKSEADAYEPREKKSRERKSSDAKDARRESKKNRDAKEPKKDRSREERNSKRDRSDRSDRRDRKASRARKNSSPEPAPEAPKPRLLPRTDSPVQVIEKEGKLRAFPSHIARDIRYDAMENRRKSLQEKNQLEVIRQKMDLDFQSVDTKRSVFMINDRVDQPAPAPSKSKSKSASKKDKKDKKSKDQLPPRPKPRRVSSRAPTLDPIRSQEALNPSRPPPRVIYESDDEDKSGSTLHSGDEKPVVLKRQPSVNSNDSTLKDIGDIPSEWNVSLMSRSRQFSARSDDSRDSRYTHRSQISSKAKKVKPIPEEKASKKKAKRSKK